MTALREKFAGCMLGLALGDAVGAPFEGGPPGEKSLEDLPPLLRYTDDTEMAMGVAESLARREAFDPEDMAGRFVGNFNPLRDYGPGAMAVLELISRGVPWEEASRAVFPQGSLGNGAAMRVAPVGLFFHRDRAALREAALGSSAVTHAHPLAQEGAFLIAHAVADALEEKGGHEILENLIGVATMDEYRDRLRAARSLLKKDAATADVARALGHGVLAVESVPTAIFAFLRHGGDCLDTLRFCVSLGGDTDTIGAMAGALLGAQRGARGLPGELLGRLEDRERIAALAEILFSSSEKN